MTIVEIAAIRVDAAVVDASVVVAAVAQVAADAGMIAVPAAICRLRNMPHRALTLPARTRRARTSRRRCRANCRPIISRSSCPVSRWRNIKIASRARRRTSCFVLRRFHGQCNAVRNRQRISPQFSLRHDASRSRAPDARGRCAGTHRRSGERSHVQVCARSRRGRRRP